MYTSKHERRSAPDDYSGDFPLISPFYLVLDSNRSIHSIIVYTANAGREVARRGWQAGLQAR
eukprot:COSAG02_NODE_15566_length_1159_cov_8.196343_1_plen_61_part_10